MEIIQQQDIAKENLPGSKPTENLAQPVETVEQAPKKKFEHHITKKNARIYAYRSHAARRQRLEKLQGEVLELKDAPVKKVIQALHETVIAENEAPINGYMGKRLACVRTQLERLNAMILVEEDPAKLDKLASATFKLSEMERIIAGRPLPGSRRPSKEPKFRPESREITPE